MHIALTLEHIDSLEQRSLWPGFGSLVFRARELLHDRTPDQIRYALAAVNYILENRNNEPVTNSPFAPADSPFLALRLHHCAAQYDIGEIPEFPQATWTELFAVLVLGLLEEAARSFRGWPTVSPADWTPTPVIENNPSIQALLDPVDAYSFACFLAAVEALAFAHAQKRLPKEVKKQISLNSRRGGIARHAKARAAEEAFWDYSQQKTFPSMREAARRFCKDYPEMVKGMRENNRIRTLTDYFSRRSRELGVKSKSGQG
jgi:hypothetical protein